MSQQFAHGYALLIGVDEHSVNKWTLPEVAKDVAAVQQVFTHPQRCAYFDKNVKVIQGSDATRDGIKRGLAWLHQRIEADASGNATAVVYYAGHGWVDTSSTP